MAPIKQEVGKLTLTGQYQHSIDAKGRINFPAKLREELGERFYITKGMENTLSVYPLSEWDRLAEKILALPLAQSRDLQLFYFGSAVEAEPDKQGRVLIPAKLREYARLDKEVIVAGMINHAEIWSCDQWEARNNALDSDSIAELMGRLSF